MPCTKSKMLSSLRRSSPKTVSMMFKGQIAIAMDLPRFRGGRAEPQDNMRIRAEAGGDFRAKTLLFRWLLEGLELIGGIHNFRVMSSSRLISCGSFAVSMMQRIGSVFLMSFLLTLRSRTSRLKTPCRPSLPNSGSTIRFCKITLAATLAA